MIKQIKPHSLSHKFLNLIFEKHEIRHGINICDVPWRILGRLGGIAGAILFILGVLLILSWMLSAVAAIWVIPSWWPYQFVEVGCITWLGIGGAYIAFKIGDVLERLFPSKDKPLPPHKPKKSSANSSPPSLLSIWWKSLKEKTCVKIVVGEEK